jgi:hypothetical protein
VVNTVALFFIYFVLISGWIGYTRSISKRPLTDNRWGTLRFVFDILIILATFYLTVLADPKIFKTNFSEAFIGVLPAISVLYLFWELIRYKEYSKAGVKGKDEVYYYDSIEAKIGDKNVLRDRLFTTSLLVVFSIVLIPIFLYFDNISVLVSPNFEALASDNYLKYTFFVIFYFILVLLYRHKKWRVAPSKEQPL